MQTAEHHREQFELAYATAWAKDRNGDETPEQLAAEIKSWRIGDTYGEDLPRLRFGWEGYQWARNSKCLAHIEEPPQPVAEICSASHDDAQFGERDIKLLRDISGFEYGTPLYAGAAPAAVAPRGDEDDSLLLCASDLQHSAIYDSHSEMQDCARSVADRIKALAAPALEAPAAPAMPAPRFDLHKFYGVQNDTDLIAAQARHIEKLQAKLAPMPAAAIQRVREG